MTRAAAARQKCGITQRPTETPSSLPAQPGKIPEALASHDATKLRV